MPGCTIPKGQRIPASVFIPFVQDYLNRYETNGHEGGWEYDWASGRFGRRDDTLEELGAASILAAEAGISHSTLVKYLAGRNEFISFDIADRILVAMGRPDLWYTDELRDIYLSVDLSEPVVAEAA